MKIGILKCGQSPASLRASYGDYDDMFVKLLADGTTRFTRFHVAQMDFPADVHAAEAWIITGSPCGVYEAHPFIPLLETFIRRAFEAQVPVIGICFGHQIVAQAMGGKVERYSGGWSIGPVDYAFGDRQVTLNAWHQDQVIVRPTGARLIASGPNCENAALQYETLALTLQPHPEFATGFVAAKMRALPSGVLPDSVIARAHRALDRPVSEDFGARTLRDFLRNVDQSPQRRPVLCP
ncbi:type 1 glutamine amidotransferase [Arenibacterium sp. LLYu02]|uniref:type 1 glutamine amidotransferase n=1 Tax=Arenibacterium sp. LLYu02 TaxID=3404132 RepID=UPI003B210F96